MSNGPNCKKTFNHFHTHFFSGEVRGGSTLRRTRNTSWSTAFSDSSAGSTPRRYQARSEKYVTPPGLWTTSGEDVVRRTCLTNLSWDILVTRTHKRSWDLSIQKESGSTFRALRISHLHTLSRCAKPLTLRKNPISAAFTWDSTLSACHYPRFTTVVEHWNEDPFENWQLCGVSKLPFCDYMVIKLNCVCFTNPPINLLDPFSVTREYHPKALELLRFIATYLQHYLEFLETHNSSAAENR